MLSSQYSVKTKLSLSLNIPVKVFLTSFRGLLEFCLYTVITVVSNLPQLVNEFTTKDDR